MVKRPTPHLNKLFSRVRRLTKERGSKAALAVLLAVAPQRLHEWLSGYVEPGGETTLQLLQWVTAAEARLKKTPPRIAAATALKTRTAKSKAHEKDQSSRRKR